jgi:hypothetical protein
LREPGSPSESSSVLLELARFWPCTDLHLPSSRFQVKQRRCGVAQSVFKPASLSVLSLLVQLGGGGGGNVTSCHGEAIFTECFFHPWKDHPSFNSSRALERKPELSISSLKIAKGFASACCVGEAGPSVPSRSKLVWFLQLLLLLFLLPACFHQQGA